MGRHAIKVTSNKCKRELCVAKSVPSQGCAYQGDPEEEKKEGWGAGERIGALK